VSVAVIIGFEKSPVVSGRATYQADEFALEYEHPSSWTHASSHEFIDGDASREESGRFFLIADTLTIAFDSATGELLSFDSYTNWKKWEQAPELKLPKVVVTGIIRLLDFPTADRFDLRVIPRYRYSSNNKLLEISLSDGSQEVDYVRVSDLLVVGIALGRPVKLLLQKLADPGAREQKPTNGIH
jgi:hypothetical protein